MTPCKKVVSIDTETLWSVFELLCNHDLFDTSRYESYYPAVRHICEALDEGGFGDRRTPEWRFTHATPRTLLKYIVEQSES